MLVLPEGPLLGGVARLGCSCGLVSNEHRVSGPVAIGSVDGVSGFVGLGIDPTPLLGYPYHGTPHECVVGAHSLGSARLRLL